jgi:hypothetical protein
MKVVILKRAGLAEGHGNPRSWELRGLGSASVGFWLNCETYTYDPHRGFRCSSSLMVTPVINCSDWRPRVSSEEVGGHCPICLAVYRPGFDTCADDGTPLVPGPAPGRSGSTNDPAVSRTTTLFHSRLAAAIAPILD